MRPITFNPKQLTKPSQVLRKAAEVIQYDMNTVPCWSRSGACAAFIDVHVGLQDTIHRDMDKVRATLNRAREIFKEHFGYTGHKRPRARKGYWFGSSFTNEQQQHRIEALLLAAEIAEVQGE